MTLALANKYTDSKVSSGGVAEDGREIELRKGETHIEWRYVGEEQWKQLVALADIKGIKGDKGEAGLGWLFGMNEPTTEGRNGDLYLRYTTFDVYKKTGGNWQKIDTIKGAKGDNGDSGKNITLQKTETHIQWKVDDGVDEWKDLIAFSDLSSVGNATISEKGLVNAAYNVGEISTQNVTTSISGTQADETLNSMRTLLNETKNKLNELLKKLKTAGIIDSNATF